ncbi:MAG: hemerythrin domain-containing protein, partial [bacterium]
MTSSLPRVAHEHHATIQVHVDRLTELAAMVGSVDRAAFATAFEDECRFITGQLVPHIAAIETGLYPELERVMGGRHSMAPMRTEHDHLRELLSSLCVYRADLLAGELAEADEIGLRRVLYRLFSILKVHLAEEELYLGVLE